MTGPNGAARMGNVLIMHRSHVETAGPPPAQETAGPPAGVRGKPACLGPESHRPTRPRARQSTRTRKLGLGLSGRSCCLFAGRVPAAASASFTRPGSPEEKPCDQGRSLPLLERDGGRLQGISSRAPPSGRPRKAESDSNAVPTLTLAKLHVRGLTSLN